MFNDSVSVVVALFVLSVFIWLSDGEDCSIIGAHPYLELEQYTFNRKKWYTLSFIGNHPIPALAH